MTPIEQVHALLEHYQKVCADIRADMASYRGIGRQNFVNLGVCHCLYWFFKVPTADYDWVAVQTRRMGQAGYWYRTPGLTRDVYEYLECLRNRINILAQLKEKPYLINTGDGCF